MVLDLAVIYFPNLFQYENNYGNFRKLPALIFFTYRPSDLLYLCLGPWIFTKIPLIFPKLHFSPCDFTYRS
jgi:hypothetical protein